MSLQPARRALVLAMLWAAAPDVLGIAGGVDVAAGQAPSMAAIIDESIVPSEQCLASGGSATFCQQVCGGTLIAPEWVVTAAHCLIGREPANLKVGVGIVDLLSATPGDFTAVQTAYIAPGAPIQQQIVYTDDIALLHLDVPVSATPASIARGADLDALEQASDSYNDEIEVLGWGLLAQGGEFPSVLQRVALDIAWEECLQIYPTLFDPQKMICSLEMTPDALEPDDTGDDTPEDPAGEDACVLDSGGPLLVASDTSRPLAGIVSWAQNASCGGNEYPAVYTRVPYYLPWIENTLAEAGFVFGDVGVLPTYTSSANPGTDATVTLAFGNLSAASVLSGLQLSLDTHATPWTIVSTSGLSCNPSGDLYACSPTTAALAPGATGSVQLKVNESTPDSTVRISFTASGQASLLDYRPQNNTGQVEIHLTGKPDLQLEFLGAPVAAAAGTRTAWVILEARNGSTHVAAAGNTLTLALPPSSGLELSATNALPCSRSADLVTCDLPDLAAGERTEVRIGLDRPAASSLYTATFTATLTSLAGDYPALRDGLPDQQQTFSVQLATPPSEPPPGAVPSGGGSAGITLLLLVMLGGLARCWRRPARR